MGTLPLLTLDQMTQSVWPILVALLLFVVLFGFCLISMVGLTGIRLLIASHICKAPVNLFDLRRFKREGLPAVEIVSAHIALRTIANENVRMHRIEEEVAAGVDLQRVAMELAEARRKNLDITLDDLVEAARAGREPTARGRKPPTPTGAETSPPDADSPGESVFQESSEAIDSSGLLLQLMTAWLMRIPLGARRARRLRQRGVSVGAFVIQAAALRQLVPSVSLDQLERHAIAGGNLEVVGNALQRAQQSDLRLTFADAARLDLTGIDPDEVVRGCEGRRVMDLGPIVEELLRGKGAA